MSEIEIIEKIELLRKFVIDTPENRIYIKENLDKGTICSPPLVREILERLQNIENKLTQLEETK